MKTVLFDLLGSQPYKMSKFHGASEYIKVLFGRLLEKYYGQCEFIVFYNYDLPLDSLLLELIKKYRIVQYDVKDRKELGEIFDKEDIDIMYSGLPYLYRKENIPSSVCFKGTIHGLRSIEMPADKYAYLYLGGLDSAKEIAKFLLKKMYYIREVRKMKRCLDALDEIVTVSEHSKYSMIQTFPFLMERNIRVYYGQSITSVSGCCLKLDCLNVPNDSFVLLLGGDRWIKNVYRSIVALDKLFDKGFLESKKVVVLGKTNRKIVHRIKNRNRFMFLDYVDSGTLEQLYLSCSLFLYPSLNEGFGFPPLEAIKYGKTCVVSGVCSLNEIFGKAVYYVNPYDIPEIATRVLYALEHPINRKIIMSQYEEIVKRQMDDLDALCEFVVGI